MTRSSTPKRRPLRPDEIQLWKAVTDTVQPRDPPNMVIEMDQVTMPESQVATDGFLAPLAAPLPVGKVPKLPPIVGLEPKVRKRLSRGRSDVDGKLDLHGFHQPAAYQKLRSFLLRAQADGARMVLVVTGKGKSSKSLDDWSNDVGVLRRAVPLWLREPDLRSVVLSVEEAARGHGGSGALYVGLRRLERSSK